MRMRAVLMLAGLAAVVMIGIASAGDPESKLPLRLGISTGAQYFVDGTSGRDTNPGTLRRPWRTIAHAWRSVPLSGSVVNVRAGTYVTPTYLSGRLASAQRPVTLRAYPGESVVLTNGAGTGAAVYIEEVRGLRIRGFRITNPASDGIKVTNSSDVELVGNTISDTGNQAIIVVGSGSAGQTYSANVQIWGNRIHGNGLGGRSAFNHGIYYGASGSVSDDGVRRGTIGGVIANNIIYDQPTGQLIQVGPQADGLIIANNTLTRATSRDPNTGCAIALWGVGRYATRRVVVVNNVVAFNANKGVHGSGPSMPTNVVHRNLAFANSGGDFQPFWGSSRLFVQDETNITGRDPRFVDVAGANFRPRAGSPLIGRADPAYAPTTDATGVIRGRAPEIGALEYVASGAGPLVREAQE
jgi:Right handed beta helix region